VPLNPTATSGGKHLNVPGYNVAFIKSVKDLSQGTPYDVLLDIVFGFGSTEWDRNIRLYAKFEKDAKGYIEATDKEFNSLCRNLKLLGLQTTNKDGNVEGVCISDKGKFVHGDDTPIKDIAALIETMSKGKTFDLYIDKDPKGKNGKHYDKVVAWIDTAIAQATGTDSEATKLYENFEWRIDYFLKNKGADSDTVVNSDSEIEYIPGS